MASRTLALTDKVYDYILDNSLREPEILKRLRMADNNETSEADTRYGNSTPKFTTASG